MENIGSTRIVRNIEGMQMLILAIFDLMQFFSKLFSDIEKSRRSLFKKKNGNDLKFKT